MRSLWRHLGRVLGLRWVEVESKMSRGEHVGSGRIRSFRDLVVWHKAMDLCVEVYRVTAWYPAHERFGLTAESRKTARSVPYNIAEGHQRRTTADYRHFVSIAHGSNGELETQLELGRRLDYLTAKQYAELATSVNEISKMLRGLNASLNTRLNSK
jgi:four helix bundle protein